MPGPREVIHVASVSGGKDSTATLLLMLDRIPKERCRAVFADTGNEDPAVYDYIDYLEEAVGLKIHRVKADFSDRIAHRRKFIANDQRIGRNKKGKKIRHTNKVKRRALELMDPTGNPYLDLCILKGRFPSSRAQFCTQELKTMPIADYELDIVERGFRVVSWRGIRREESRNRRNTKSFYNRGGGLYTWHPIVDWDKRMLVDYVVGEKGLRFNPLYQQGFDRVGCMPCINCSKKEIQTIAARRPEVIDRIEGWERLVGLASKRGRSTFFAAEEKERHLSKFGIREMVDWSKTEHGGRQFSLFPVESVGCVSSLGLCE
jgi:3'-phosphoadenosine 5'-phosphosulfate sulfotransferase (PAPS reductase)/FAD synthetase